MKRKGLPVKHARKDLPSEQLRRILRRFPADRVDIHGVILDYAARSGETVDQILELNPKLDAALFAADQAKAGHLLLECVVSCSEEAHDIARRCGDRFPNLRKLLDGLRSTADVIYENRGDSPRILIDPSSSLGYPVKTILWQLSDIHFGKYNKLGMGARDLAYMIAKVAVEYQAIKPNAVVISGDVSSMARKSEFEEFCLFCESLSSALWEGVYAGRILVVPGNHDVTWRPDGTADCMKEFARHVSRCKACVTPFGPETEEFEDNSIAVVRYGANPTTVPPLATVSYVKHGLEIVMLVSGYFSGRVPNQARNIIERSNGSIDDLLSLIRIDEGEVNPEYLFRIAKTCVCGSNVRVALVHHNPCSYGMQLCTNRLAQQLLETLSKANVPVILHGHIHMIEDNGRARPSRAGEAYPIPCPTISAQAATKGNGMAIHLVGGESGGAYFDTLVWELSDSGSFTPRGLAVAHRLLLREGVATVRYGSD